MAPNQKVNLKDKVDDGEMDLSMCDLQDVPVKEIATYRKVYCLDLSNNHLAQLPKNFAILTNLTKLDLSKNKLRILPDNFGDLVKLKHLDLYKNELQHLPISFGKLRSLKWLDLKDNPLVPAIKETAGPCLDSKQCQLCASNIVSFYAELKEKIDEERENREKQRQKDKLATETAQKAKQQEKKKKKEKTKPIQEKSEKPEEQIEEKPVVQVSIKRHSKISCIFTCMLLLFVLAFVSLFVVTSLNLKETEFISNAISRYWHLCMDSVPPAVHEFGNKTGVLFIDAHQKLGRYILELRENDNVVYMFNKIKEYYSSISNNKK